MEGLPQLVMMTQRGGIPHLRETLENILDWPLSEGTDFILAEAAITRRFPTQHGHHSSAPTYGIVLELGKREAYGQLSYPSFGASYSSDIGRQRARCVRRMYNTDGGTTASTIYTITAVPEWVENVHLLDSEHSITVVQIRGAPISAGPKASVIKSLEAQAYANYFLFTAEDLMSDVTHAMLPRPELIFIYTQMDYEQQEGNNKPLRTPEMILQVRLRAARNCDCCGARHGTTDT